MTAPRSPGAIEPRVRDRTGGGGDSGRPIATQIAALKKISTADLVIHYTRLHGVPPHCRNRVWLWRRCAWKIQELACGGLPPDAKARLEQLIAEVAPGDVRKTRPRGELAPGTTLTREWHGVQVSVRVADDGSFVHDGKPYRSLSAVAQAVTGQHWNGRLFWGLRKRSKKGP
jgi:hypothetical protein